MTRLTKTWVIDIPGIGRRTCDQFENLNVGQFLEWLRAAGVPEHQLKPEFLQYIHATSIETEGPDSKGVVVPHALKKEQY